MAEFHLVNANGSPKNIVSGQAQEILTVPQPEV